MPPKITPRDLPDVDPSVANPNDPPEPPLDPMQPTAGKAKKGKSKSKAKAVEDRVEDLAGPKLEAELLADIPDPFRPSILAQMIADFAEQHHIPAGDKRLRGYNFIAANGLPKPKIRVAVQGIDPDGDRMPIDEFEAFDPGDGIRQYADKFGINADKYHTYRFRHVIREE